MFSKTKSHYSALALLLFQITITLNLVVLAVSEMEMNVISAERVTEYTNLPSEVSQGQIILD